MLNSVRPFSFCLFILQAKYYSIFFNSFSFRVLKVYNLLNAKLITMQPAVH